MTARTDWFDEARFGIFVHWDHASQEGLEVSWPMVGGNFALPRCQTTSPQHYRDLARTFDPQAWDPVDLARRAADAGAGYVVLTAKHHSGFALWPTATSDFHIGHTPHGDDIVGPYVEAVRAAGLRVGLYVSLSDWSHPDYPALQPEHLPYRLGSSPPYPGDEAWARFLDAQRTQLTELLTSYGTIDLLWFDGGWERRPHVWQPHETEAHIRRLAPDIVLNDRLYGVGDYTTPEQFVPPVPPDRRWETCMTMNDSWGWHPGDTDWKSGRQLVHTLCEVAGKGGNLLLNVSPMGDGTLPPEQAERLEHVGRWLRRHREAIVGTTAGLEPWQCYGPSTQRSSASGTTTSYVHLLHRPFDTVTVRGLPVRRIRRVRVVGDDTGAPLDVTTRTGIMESLQPDPPGELTITLPPDLIDDDATVLAIELAEGSQPAPS